MTIEIRFLGKNLNINCIFGYHDLKKSQYIEYRIFLKNGTKDKILENGNR